MDFKKLRKTIKSTVFIVLFFTLYLSSINFYNSKANAGELDETLKKLLSVQQSRHKESAGLDKNKNTPQSIEELFASRQGILSKTEGTAKKPFIKSGSNININSHAGITVKKNTAVKKAAAADKKNSVSKTVKSQESDEPETLEDVITSQSVVVLDEYSGKLLYSKDPFKKRAPASLTKIMTAIVLLDSGHDLKETITIKHDISIRSDGVSLGLKKGDKTNLLDLLYMSLLYSANDACVAIAEEVAGSVREFAALMNKQAKDIGAVNTNFVNPNGMPDNRHYSTAYDLAILSAYAMKNPVFAKIVGTKKHTVKLITHKEVKVKVKKSPDAQVKTVSVSKSKSKKSQSYTIEKKIVEVTRRINLSNRHKLLGKNVGVKGIKTGYTRAAGRCLATAYSHAGKKLIIIVLKARDVVSDTIALIDCDKYLNASNIALKSSAEKPAAISEQVFPQKKEKITLSTVRLNQ